MVLIVVFQHDSMHAQHISSMDILHTNASIYIIIYIYNLHCIDHWAETCVPSSHSCPRSNRCCMLTEYRWVQCSNNITVLNNWSHLIATMVNAVPTGLSALCCIHIYRLKHLALLGQSWQWSPMVLAIAGLIGKSAVLILDNSETVTSFLHYRE